jgi:hypothetical protein
MPQENPLTEPQPQESAPLNIKLSDLYAEPDSVNREAFTPAENVAFDFAVLVVDALQHTMSPDDDMLPTEAEFAQQGPHDFLTPATLNFSHMRAFNGEGSDFLHYSVRLGEWSDSPSLSVTFVTERAASEDKDPEPSDEELVSFSIDFAHDGRHSTERVESERPAETDEAHIALFANTHSKLVGMIEDGYMPIVPEK